MTENNWIEQVVEKVVAEVLHSQMEELQKTLVARVLEAVGPQPERPAGAESSPGNLLKAISSIQTGSTQREILRTLLDQAVRYSGRAALFVIKAGAATGWQGRGFPNQDDVKDFPLDVNSGVAARTLQSRTAFQVNAREMDAKFIERFGAPSDSKILLLPLLLKERVAALVYADGGSESGHLDAAAMELLVVAASAWLEVAASRKLGQKEGVSEATAAPKARAAAASPSSSDPFAGPPQRSDSFAGHAPQASASTAVADEAPPVSLGNAVVEAEPPALMPEPEPAPAIAEVPAPPPVAAEPSPEDLEVHRKAQRFARLLVDEIKLYNQAKVTEGRSNKDLYDRLKDDIDKSLATYEKRYGGTVAASSKYFNQEIIRSLAEDDASVMGANFQR
jgi:hypothetical protein